MVFNINHYSNLVTNADYFGAEFSLSTYIFYSYKLDILFVFFIYNL